MREEQGQQPHQAMLRRRLWAPVSWRNGPGSDKNPGLRITGPKRGQDCPHAAELSPSLNLCGEVLGHMVPHQVSLPHPLVLRQMEACGLEGMDEPSSTPLTYSL